jgi:hypothetical protein
VVASFQVPMLRLSFGLGRGCRLPSAPALGYRKAQSPIFETYTGLPNGAKMCIFEGRYQVFSLADFRYPSYLVGKARFNCKYEDGKETAKLNYARNVKYADHDSQSPH